MSLLWLGVSRLLLGNKTASQAVFCSRRPNKQFLLLSLMVWSEWKTPWLMWLRALNALPEDLVWFYSSRESSVLVSLLWVPAHTCSPPAHTCPHPHTYTYCSQGWSEEDRRLRLQKCELLQSQRVVSANWKNPRVSHLRPPSCDTDHCQGLRNPSSSEAAVPAAEH